jgi:hypothetical protein
MQVATGDRVQPVLGHPGEELAPVEELHPVEEP